MYHNIKNELRSIIDGLEDAIKDAEKFDKGNDTAGIRVRKAAHEGRARLLGMRGMVTEMREERSRNQPHPAE